MFDLVIVGMGSAGVTAAEFAARLDLSVAVVERARVGGTRLWTGCVPSNALVASAKAAHTMRTADRWGLEPLEPKIDLTRVWRRVRGVQAQMAATSDNPQTFRDLGVELVHGEARVSGPDEVTVRTDDGHDRVLRTRFVLVCTGSRPRIPPIEGLDPKRCLTTDSLFEVQEPPGTVAVIGGGPVGVEMAQALQRLGVQVILFQRAATLLPREEPSLVARLTQVLQREGVVVHCTADVHRIDHQATRTVVMATVGHDGKKVSVPVQGVLVAVGRTPRFDDLGLAELGVQASERGIEVDAAGRTSVRTIYAVGDVTGRPMLTNTAAHEAVVAVRDMFFPGRGSTDAIVPWCTFTDPELAHVGLTVEAAEAAYGTDTDVWRFDLEHNDRARTDAVTDGGMVVITGKGRVVGAHVLAPGAGDIIHELALAVNQQSKLEDLADLVHVYPTLSSAVGQLATEATYEKAHRLRWLMKRR
ncbi:MAG: NAD(P)/FAD-dependent oxidoreductase [Actinobacteria bacterium]|nr:NAD(P)/FAD-dependent oxidoreductase [Actinomycetota bacterium]